MTMYRVLFITTLIMITFLTFKITFAFFADTAASTSNTFTASAEFPTSNITETPTPTITTTPTTSPTSTAHLVINEVLYDLNSDQRFSGDPNTGEWIEIYNPSTASQDLTNWTLEDNTASETLSGTLPAGGFLLLIATSSAEFQSKWSIPGSPIFVIASGGKIGSSGLADGGDRAIIKNNLGEIIDQISWEGNTTVFNPAIPPVASGHSIQRSVLGLDTDSIGDFIDTNPPTPGS